MNSTAIRTTMSLNDWLMLLMLAFVWGGSFYFIGVAVKELPPLTIVLLRVAIAALTLWCVILVLRIKLPRQASVWWAFLVMGLLNNVIPFGLIVWGQQHIASGLAAILNATTPLITVALAGIFLSDEKITAKKLMGIALGLVGLIIMFSPTLIKTPPIAGAEAKPDNTQLLGQLAIIGATLSYGFAFIFGRRFRRMNVSPLVTAAGQVSGSSLLLLPIVFWVEQPLSLAAPSSMTWVSVIALATVCTAFAYILYFRILSSAGASNLSLVALLVPVTAIILGNWLLAEQLEQEHYWGMLTIALGLLVIDGRLWNFASTALKQR